MPILMPEERLGLRIAERYRLEALVSSGGMGVLFRAHDETTGESVAVKMLKPSHALDADRVARFSRETRIASSIRHPNIARVLEVWSDDNDVSFLVMELLEGRSLAQELDERGTLPFAETMAIAIPIASALSTAHALGVVHRDIKPSNIFLCRDATTLELVPKLLDFGIARSTREGFETDTGMLLGTPGYMAPEHAQYGECSPASDTWGLGAVIYRCLTGHPPHASGSVQDMLAKLVRHPVPPLELAGVGKQACASIDRALALDPDRRYPSIEIFGRVLRGLLPGGHATAEETAELEREAAALPASFASSAHAPDAEPALRGRAWRSSGSWFIAVAAGALLLLGMFSPGSARTMRAAGERARERRSADEETALSARPSQSAASELPIDWHADASTQPDADTLHIASIASIATPSDSLPTRLAPARALRPRKLASKDSTAATRGAATEVDQMLVPDPLDRRR